MRLDFLLLFAEMPRGHILGLACPETHQLPNSDRTFSGLESDCGHYPTRTGFSTKSEKTVVRESRCGSRADLSSASLGSLVCHL